MKEKDIIEEEVRELKLDLNTARRQGNREAYYRIQERINGLKKVNKENDECTECNLPDNECDCNWDNEEKELK